VDTTEACSADEYEAVQPLLLTGSQFRAFGPMDITIQANHNFNMDPENVPETPREKAYRLAKEESKKASSQPVKKAVPQPAATKPATKPAEDNTDAEDQIEALQDFLDEAEAEGALSPAESEVLLKKAFNADQPLLRCFRINRNKGKAKLISRMKLLLPRDTAKPTASDTQSAPGKADIDKKTLEELAKKVNALPNSGTIGEADLDKMMGTLGELRSKLGGQKGMDTATLDKLDQTMRSARAMAASSQKKKNGDNVGAANDAADAARMVGGEVVPEPDEL